MKFPMNTLVLGAAEDELKGVGPFFPERVIDETPITRAAYLAALELLSGRILDTDMQALAAGEIIRVLGMAAGGQAYKRPFVAMDPWLVLRGSMLERDPNDTYLLAAVTSGGQRAFPGGFCDERVSATATLIKELVEEVMGTASPEDLIVPWVFAEQSTPTRATSRWLAYQLQVASIMGFVIPRPDLKIKPQAGSDAAGWEYVRILKGNDPDWVEINARGWRDDHLALLSAFVANWPTVKVRRGIQGGLVDYLESLTPHTIVETGFAPTPEAAGKYAFPNTYNVQLSVALVARVLHGHKVSDADAAAQEIVEQLVGAGFVPHFNGPLYVVDPFAIGSGKYANHILCIEQNGKVRLPGVFVRHGESAFEAAQRALISKAGCSFTPMHFIGMEPEWVAPGETRDPRGTMMSVVIAGPVTAHDDPPGITRRWVPLVGPDGGLHPEAAAQEYLYHHDLMLERAARMLVDQRIYVPGTGQTLLQAIQDRGFLI